MGKPKSLWLAAAEGVLVAALMLGPVVIGRLRTPDGAVYTGYAAGGPDYGSYLSKIRQGWEGQWLWQGRLDPEDTGRRPLFLYYLALGHLGRALGLSAGGLPVIFYAVGAIGLMAAAVSVWRFMVRAGVPAAAGTWLALAGGAPVGPLWPQPHLYMAAYFPHYSVVVVALCEWLGLVWSGAGWWWAAVPGAVLSVIHPEMAGVAALALALYGLLQRRSRKRAWWLAAAGAAGAAPFTTGVAWMLRADPYVRAWRAQVPAYPIVPWLPFAWFGALAVVALAGFVLIARRQEVGDGTRMALSWAVAAVALSWLSPVHAAGSEYALGLAIPLAALAVPVIQAVRAGWARLGLIAACSLGLVAGAWWLYVRPDRQVVRYLPATEWRALQASASCARAAGDRPLWVRPEVAPLVPWLTGARVWWGHPSETTGAEVRRAQMVQMWKQGAEGNACDPGDR